MDANIELVQHLYGAFMQGDREAVRAAVSPDVTFSAPGSSAVSGTWRGADAVIEHLFEGDPLVEDYRLDVVDMLASDTRVAVIATTSGLRDGRRIVNDFVQVLTIAEGRVAEVRNYAFDLAGLEEALSAPA